MDGWLMFMKVNWCENWKWLGTRNYLFIHFMV